MFSCLLLLIAKCKEMFIQVGGEFLLEFDCEFSYTVSRTAFSFRDDSELKTRVTTLSLLVTVILLGVFCKVSCNTFFHSSVHYFVTKKYIS